MKNNRFRYLLIILILIALVIVALFVLKNNADTEIAARAIQDALK